MIKKLLIANRGEIACRIIRTARKMGIETVAVYSDIDKGSKHVELADKAFHIGPSPSSQSYLNANKILDVAAKSGAEAIHPGFGFLSENADFADLINKNGKIFVGPPGSAIRSMGSKSESKKIMTAAGVPVVGGYFGENQDPKFLLEEAKKIGFPVLIKAVSGGGGKGMKIVKDEGEFLGQLESAKREALKSFKDDRVLVEKYISRSRHIEIQVFGDKLKNYVYLFERDCSVQRRHQKVIEEAPSTITQDLRASIGKSAIDAARAVGYYNAGTVEFIFDVETNKYYFMEMNTRLQVEHPITEMITGQDLVEWQLLVASGKALPKKQEELSINGHSIETRIYSEDPYNNFLPGNGKIHYMRLPKEDKDLRLEMGVRENDEISIFYDPMIAKLVVWGKTRDLAVQKMIGGLKDFKIGGLVNNVNFLRKCFEHEEFRSSHYDTRFIGQNQDQLLQRVVKFDNDSLIGAILLRVCRNFESDIPNSFRNFRVTQPYSTNLSFKAKLTQSTAEPVSYTATITGNEEAGFSVSVTGPQGKVDVTGITLNQVKEHYVSFSANKNIIEKEIWVKDNKLTVFEDNSEILEITFDETKIGTAKSLVGQDKNSVKAPMPGTVVKVLVKEGDSIKAGAPVLIMEAMKMEHTIKAPKDIVVKKVNFKEGQFVDLGQTIIAFD